MADVMELDDLLSEQCRKCSTIGEDIGKSEDGTAKSLCPDCPFNPFNHG